jgi:hypothetical protein
MVRLARGEATSAAFDSARCNAAFSQAPKRATRVLVTSRPSIPQAFQASFAADSGQQWQEGRLVSISTREGACDDLFHSGAPPADAVNLAAVPTRP